MYQPNDVPWFRRESSDVAPVYDQRPPRVDPDFPSPTPHQFNPAPQHQFPTPTHRTFSDDFGRNDEYGGERGFRDREGGIDRQQEQPLPPQKKPPPPSGFRIPLASNAEFPPHGQAGPPVCKDADGVSPVFVGSAILPDSVHPCKIAPSVHPPCRVPYGGTELEHHGRYDLLPITPDMEWVPTKNGEIPHGRRPVEGGYESGGEKLFHALGKVNGVDVPGKTGKHLVSGFLISAPPSIFLGIYVIEIRIERREHTFWLSRACPSRIRNFVSDPIQCISTSETYLT